MRRMIVPVLFATLLLGQAAGTAAKGVVSQPNFILIVADDLGHGELGCYGQRKIKTPHLDQLAAQGLRFTQHYAGNNVCAPSRCSLLTGLHPGHAFIRDNREVRPEGQFPLPAGTVTLPSLLKAAGYRTACIGKWGLGGPGSTGDPLRQGFDSFFGYNCQRHAHTFFPSYLWRDDLKLPLDGKTYAHDLLEEEMLRWLDQAGKQPFFLYLPFTLPHLALQIPEAELAPYLGQWEEKPYDGKKGYTPHPTPRTAYAAMISRLDRSVGRLMAKLKERGLDEQTLVLFTSDNGATHDVGGVDTEFFQSVGELRGRKGSMYEGGLRVPLLARWPGHVRPGRVSTLPSASWDLLPTLLELAAANRPAGLDGLSLVPTLLEQGNQLNHEYLYWESPGYGGQQAIRAGAWKGIRRQIGKGNLKLELYHLAEDAGEKADVAERHPEVVAKLTKWMDQAHQPSQEFPLLPGERR